VRPTRGEASAVRGPDVGRAVFRFAPILCSYLRSGAAVSSIAAGLAGSLVLCLGSDRSLDVGSHGKQLSRQSREQFALGIVGCEIADQVAILGVDAELFQFRFQILHRAITAYIGMPGVFRSVHSLRCIG